MLIEAKISGRGGVSKSLHYFRDHLGGPQGQFPLALQVALDLPYVERDCFALTRPMIVPAATFLTQLA